MVSCDSPFLVLGEMDDGRALLGSPGKRLVPLYSVSPLHFEALLVSSVSFGVSSIVCLAFSA